MSKKILFKVNIILIGFVSALLTACATSETADTQPANKDTTPSKLQYAGKQNAVTDLSESGNYRFTLYSKPEPIPLRKIHQWILKVETKAGKPVTNAKIYISGGMPAHRHGFPTKPVVKKHLGNGKYLVEGIKFSMPGYWEMRFTMKIDNQRERVKFKINIH